MLEVHEQIEKPMSEQVHDGDSDVMDEEDKALLRNLCNVSIFVWISIDYVMHHERNVLFNDLFLLVHVFTLCSHTT